MEETIFFATFVSNNGSNVHDRRTYFSEDKTLIDFTEWIEKARCEIEEKGKTKCSVTFVSFIQK